MTRSGLRSWGRSVTSLEGGTVEMWEVLLVPALDKILRSWLIWPKRWADSK